MISICYSTRDSNPMFKEHLKKSSGVDNVEIFEFVNNGEYSLSELYNKFIESSNNDICVCLHDDIILENGWGKKLLKDFSTSDASIIGKAGSIEMPHSGIYWEKMNTAMVGHIYHHPEGKEKYLSKYSNKFNQLIEVVTVDGVFLSFNKQKIKHKFDEYFNGFHFYDHSFCIPNFIDKCKIYVTFSFDLTHKSIGMTNDSFEYNKIKFVKKFNNILPIKSDISFITNTKNPIIKKEKQKLVTIIIPHIHKNDLLFKCIESLYRSTTYINFYIIIADTGSSNDEIIEIENFIMIYDNIKLVRYNYYNFAKINNDVVLTHIDKNTNYLLFLNNDIEFIENNDVLSRLVNTLDNNPTTASCGPRMYFGYNKPIQHSGMLAYVDKNNSFQITHHGINSFYNHHRDNKEVFGNTGACLLFRHNVFLKLGLFNEKYSECFEDVELCANAIVHGYKNIHVSDAVCIHKESQTRNESNAKLDRLKQDYKNLLAPFVQNNFQKLQNYIYKFN